MSAEQRVSAEARAWTIDTVLRKHPQKSRVQVSATIAALEDVGQGDNLEKVARVGMANQVDTTR